MNLRHRLSKTWHRPFVIFLFLVNGVAFGVPTGQSLGGDGRHSHVRSSGAGVERAEEPCADCPMNVCELAALCSTHCSGLPGTVSELASLEPKRTPLSISYSPPPFFVISVSTPPPKALA